jgi:hypothetical protein
MRLQTLALAIVSGLVIAPAAGQPIAAATHFRGVSVDTRGIARRIGPAFADRIQRLMAPAAANAFAGLITPGSGPMLVLQIDDLELGPLTNMLDGGTDSVLGAGLIVDRGRVLAQYPLRAAHASDGSNTHSPIDLVEQRRLSDVCDFYAQWLRRKMGL